jgi:hypothetical protein
MATGLMPSRTLRAFLLIVDVGFIVYWLVSALHLLPAAWLYAHHDDDVMVSWNWSFMPIDLLASAAGLSSMWVARRHDARWRLLAAVSLGATCGSGLNAIAFWALRREFEVGWWLPNLALMLLPLPLFVQLWRQPASSTQP